MPLDKHHQQVAIGTIYSRLVRRAYTYSAQGSHYSSSPNKKYQLDVLRQPRAPPPASLPQQSSPKKVQKKTRKPVTR